MTTGNRRIINYSMGALGNRLRPLSSAYAISQETGRDFCQVWNDSQTTNGTLARFGDLFSNKIEEITSEDLTSLEKFSIYSNGYIDGISSKYGLHDLKNMAERGAHYSINSYDAENTTDNIIIYSHDFVPNTSRDLCYDFIRSLKPIPIIQNQISHQVIELGLDKSIVGVHARGTDFMEMYGFNVNYYLDKMHQYEDSVRFFLSTDDKESEEEICNNFKGRVITRRDRLHLVKDIKDDRWNYNFTVTKESSQDSVVDLYLLSKTNIGVYHPESSFCEVARILS
jgi:hypothetical protein|tara:strand:+ start:404 stop:1252 length:849 start_codon:yes stop_codon:yes gene_type:complete